VNDPTLSKRLLRKDKARPQVRKSRESVLFGLYSDAWDGSHKKKRLSTIWLEFGIKASIAGMKRNERIAYIVVHP